MNNTRKGAIGVGLVFLIAALAFASGALVALVARPSAPVGGFSEHTDLEQFLGGLTEGGGVLNLKLTTTAPTTTLSASNFCSTGFINLEQFDLTSVTTGTLTLPTSQQLFSQCLAPGQNKSIVIRNTGTSTSTVNIAPGAGMQLIAVGSTSTAGTPATQTFVVGSSSAVLVVSQLQAGTSSGLFYKGAQ